MANEKRLIDADAWESFYKQQTEGLIQYDHYCDGYGDAFDHVDDWMDAQPTVDAVEVEKYNDLREAFIDYVCSGTSNPAPYCKNRCVECVDRRGWCISQSNKCRGFNPDGEGR